MLATSWACLVAAGVLSVVTMLGTNTWGYAIAATALAVVALVLAVRSRRATPPGARTNATVATALSGALTAVWAALWSVAAFVVWVFSEASEGAG